MLKKYILKSKQLSKRFFSTKDDILDTDVMIIGGGVAGLSIANALIKSNISNNITIVDQQEYQIDNNKFKYYHNRVPDMRAVSLTPGSMNFLRSVGVKEKLNEDLLTYTKEMQVWEKLGSSFVNVKKDNIFSINKFIKENFLNKTTNNYDYISCMIEINHLLMGLYSNIKDNKINTVKTKLSIDNFKVDNTDSEYCYFTIKNEKEEELIYRTKLLIVCDGNKSIVRSKLNIPTTGYDYHESGIVCTVKGNFSSKTAYQRFLHDGIFALLPMYDNYYSIVCSMPKEINETLKGLSDEEFINFVNHVLHSPSKVDLSHIDRLILSNNNNFTRPPVIESIHSQRISFPYQLIYVDNPVSNNVVVIGDSSHSIHPMAGQGMNLGIADVAILSNLLYKGKSEGKKLNDKTILNEYSTLTQINTKSIILGMEGFKLMYSRDNMIETVLRNIGNTVINNSQILKGMLVDIGSGTLLLPDKYNWEI